MAVYLMGESPRIVYENEESRSSKRQKFASSRRSYNKGCNLISEFLNLFSREEVKVIELSADLNSNNSILTRVKERPNGVGKQNHLCSFGHDLVIEGKAIELSESNVSQLIVPEDVNPDPENDILVIYIENQLTDKNRDALLDALDTLELGDGKKSFNEVHVSVPLSVLGYEDNLSVLFEKITTLGENLFVITTMDELRAVGMISKGISWERTAYDTIKILYDSFLKRVCEEGKLIVRADKEGALLLSRKDQNKPLGESNCMGVIYFDPLSYEGELTSKLSGCVHGENEIFCASLILSYFSNKSQNLLSDIAMKQALIAVKKNFTNGYRKVGNEVAGNDHFVVFDRKYILERRIGTCKFFTGGRDSATNSLDWSEIKINDLKDRSLHELVKASERQGQTNASNLEIAKGFVKEGFNSIQAESNISIAQFGKLVTVDRSEIENLRSAFRRICEFVEDKNTVKPLSISVFGPPGCGKSFSVKELIAEIKSIYQGVISDKFHEINVAQLGSVHELAKSLQSVRNDVIDNKIPVIFLDEFDSDYDGDSKWLKYFLAPMQDGEFRDDNSSHSLGKVIFVFAGGTAHRLEEFIDNAKKGIEHGFDYASDKVPDFVSRLSGFIDVIGPNKRKNDENDNSKALRRAILLRSIITRSAPNIVSGNRINIAEDLLDSFLRVPEYEHGARSMESIISMSNITGKSYFDMSCLPPNHMLSLHANAVKFFDPDFEES
jgi:hypothetical protein